MAANPAHQQSARTFIDHCISIFGWTDLSKDAIMDLGCGAEAYCSKSILERFPGVQSIVGIEKNMMIVQKLNSNPIKKIRCDYGDIEKGFTLEEYEGKMTKIVSTHMFHQLTDKKCAFENVNSLLQPGGEAAILFVRKSHFYEWIKEMLKIPKWRDIYQGHEIVDLFSEELETFQCKEMAQHAGFRIVDCSEEEREVPFPSDEICKVALHKIAGDSFKLLPESVAEFIEDSFRIVEKNRWQKRRGVSLLQVHRTYFTARKASSRI